MRPRISRKRRGVCGSDLSTGIPEQVSRRSLRMQATTWHLPGARRNVAPCLVGSDGVQILHDGFLIGFLARMHLVRPAALDRDAQAGRAASKPWPPLSRPSPVSPRGGSVLQRSSPSGSSPSCRRRQNHRHRALEGADAGLAAERAAAPSLASGRRAWTARILATRLTVAGETGGRAGSLADLCPRLARISRSGARRA